MGLRPIIYNDIVWGPFHSISFMWSKKPQRIRKEELEYVNLWNCEVNRSWDLAWWVKYLPEWSLQSRWVHSDRKGYRSTALEGGGAQGRGNMCADCSSIADLCWIERFMVGTVWEITGELQGKIKIKAWKCVGEKSKREKFRSTIEEGLQNTHPKWDKNCRMVLKENLFIAIF